MPDLTTSNDMDALMQAADFAAFRTSLSLTALATTTPGTGVATALGVNIGSAGAPVLFNGAGGTPSSLTLTNATDLPTAGLLNSAVTLAKIQNAAANSKLLGSGAAGSGAAYVEITIGSGLTMTGTTLSASGGAGIGGDTGATDNAILRADGAGGATLQNSGITIGDVASSNVTLTSIASTALTLATPDFVGNTGVLVRGGDSTSGGSFAFRVQNQSLATLLSLDSGGVMVASGQINAPSFQLTGAGGILRTSYDPVFITNPILQWPNNTPDASIVYVTTGTLAQRSGATPQSYLVENTYTDDSNYERGTFGWSSNVLRIGASAAGSGTLRSINLIGAGLQINGTPGVSAGPFTVITSITVVNGIVTALTGS